MATTGIWFKRMLIDTGVILLVMVGLLLFAVFAVAMRPILIVAAIVAIVGYVVLSCFSPGFREWFVAAGEQVIPYKGLHLATDVNAHPSHSWARVRRGHVVVGADDLVQATLGPVDAVELPAVGTRVEQGDRLCCLRRGERNVELRSPISGTVLQTNEALLDRPEFVNEGPFAKGWVARLRPDKVREEEGDLLRGRQARGWFRQEVDRLLAMVLSDGDLNPVLPDGGALVPELHRHIDDEAWQTLTETLFTNPKA